MRAKEWEAQKLVEKRQYHVENKVLRDQLNDL